MLKFASINVEGLRDNGKRNNVFQSLSNLNLDVIAIQETHCDVTSESKWKKEWPGKSLWTTGRNDSAGVAFLFNPNLDISILDQETDFDGRILKVIIKIDDKKFQLLNIYAHNPTVKGISEYFFESLDNYIDPDIPPILLGDFNMVEDLYLDRCGGNPKPRHTYGLESLNELKETHNLVDIWRIKNLNTRLFTWHCRYKKIHSRLDRIYTPSNLTPNVIKTYIQHFVWSDHDMCVMQLEGSGKQKRGNGYWKLNIQYLEHERYIQKITSFWRDWKNKKHLYDDLQTWWDLGKIYIKSLSISYAQDLYQIQRNKKDEILTQLEFERGSDSYDLPKIDNLKKQLRDLEMEKNKKLFLYTHTVVRDADEEPTKYFYDLLKTNQAKATMKALLSHEGKILTKQSEMIEEAKSFYQKLYKEENEVSIDDQNFFLSTIKDKLSEEQKVSLERDITLQELKNALMDTNKEKTPGYDGLPYEFYITFWNLIAQDFLEVTQYSLYTAKYLSCSQTTSIITLIYKKDDRMKIINWRPISLLCCDYKIIAKALANRTKNVLHSILSPTQTSSVPGRSIFQNLNLMRDILVFCDIKKINAFILSIDQEKAFDKLNRTFLLKILDRMNFGTRFISWIETLYKGNKGHLLLNGYVSSVFDIERGVRQGCPLSAILYSIYIETLALAIKREPTIFGIPIPGKQNQKIIQYADDMNLLLSDRTSFYDLSTLFRRFQRATGSTINANKTKGLVLGKPKMPDRRCIDIIWRNKEGMEVLGILFFPKYETTRLRNWLKIRSEMEAQIRKLKSRPLSLKGKVLLLNTVVMAKMWYVASVYPNPSEKKFKKSIYKPIFNFLWNKENASPIKKKTVFQPRERGGLGLKDFEIQQISMQLKFIQDLVDKDNTAPWTQLGRYWLGLHLAPINNDWNFLIGNDVPKPDDGYVPTYYKEILQQFQNIYKSDFRYETSIIYKDLLQQKAHYPKSFTSFWVDHRVDPETMWKHIYTSYADGWRQDIHYKFNHRILPTNAFLKHRFKGKGYENQSDICPICQVQKETIQHLFFRCTGTRPILRYIYPSLTCLLRNKSFKIFKLVLNKFPPNTPTPVAQTCVTLVQITMHTIWGLRNEAKFNSKIKTIEEAKSEIKSVFTDTLSRHFRKHNPGAITRFQLNFCHTPDICRILPTGELDVNILSE